MQEKRSDGPETPALILPASVIQKRAKEDAKRREKFKKQLRRHLLMDSALAIAMAAPMLNHLIRPLTLRFQTTLKMMIRNHLLVSLNL